MIIHDWCPQLFSEKEIGRRSEGGRKEVGRRLEGGKLLATITNFHFWLASFRDHSSEVAFSWARSLGMPSSGQLTTAEDKEAEKRAALFRSLGIPFSAQLATAEDKELFEAFFAEIDDLMAALSERKTVLKTEKTPVNRHLAYWVKEITPTGLETIKKHLKRRRDVSTQVAANCLHPEPVCEAS